MKHILWACFFVLMACSKPQDKPPVTPPVDTTHHPVDTTRNPPKDTTTQPPKDTTVHHDTVITKVLALTSVLDLTDTAMVRGALQISNSYGQQVDLRMTFGSNIHVKFISADHHPKVTKIGVQDFEVVYSDSLQCRYVDFKDSDTLNHCGWIIEGIDRKKYGIDRVRVVFIDDNFDMNGGTLLVRVGDMKDGFVPDDAFIRKSMESRLYGIANLNY